jgi:succinyl-CoA synthetase alpha subunit
MRQALDLLLEDPKVEAVCVNIFGGILSCAEVAKALVGAVASNPPAKPVVVRLSGNRAEEGLRLLDTARIANVHPVETLDAAMEKLHTLTGVRAPAHAHTDIPPAPTRRTPPASPAPFPLGAGTRVLVQGITGKQGQLHTRLMQEYGTQVVAGVTPGKGGTTVLGVPVYHTVEAACARHAIDASILFVPAPLAPDAILEAAACGIPWIVCITDGIPQQDMLRVLEKTRSLGCRIIGPNCPGLIVPGGTKIGIMPASIFSPGPIAVLSRSGTLTYETVARLSAAGLGQ